METEYYTNKWLRWYEIVSLVVAIVATTLLFIGGVVVFLPYSPSLKSTDYINDFFLVMMSFTIIFTLDGIFGNSLKHYVCHQEKREDVMWARLSSIFILGDFISYILLYILLIVFH